MVKKLKSTVKALHVDKSRMSCKEIILQKSILELNMEINSR